MNANTREWGQTLPCPVRKAGSLDPRGEDAAHTGDGIFIPVGRRWTPPS